MSQSEPGHRNRFWYTDELALLTDAERLGVQLPWSNDLSPLFAPLDVGRSRLPNRLRARIKPRIVIDRFVGSPRNRRAKPPCLSRSNPRVSECGGESRGGAMVLETGGVSVGGGLSDRWRFARTEPSCSAELRILEVSYRTSGEVAKRWVNVRPIPESVSWFERMWAEFRTGDVYSMFEEEERG